MDQSSEKFSELSPVLELVYVMLTSASRYVNSYAKDIDATRLEQYLEAKNALEYAIKKFDALYGLETSGLIEDDDDDMFVEETVAVAPAQVSAQSSVVAPVSTPTASAEQPYDFASGADEESLTKAKQAVDELKALFADMKKKEEELAQAPVASQPVMPQPQVTPVQQPMQQQPQMQSAPVQMPTPMNTAPSAQPAKDASEIDAILAELRKLQNKGSAQL